MVGNYNISAVMIFKKAHIDPTIKQLNRNKNDEENIKYGFFKRKYH